MEIEIFKPGKFTSMEGADVSVSPAVLRDIAARYDGDIADAPVVVGHPDHDSPAYGWVKQLRYDANDNRLMADIGDLSPEFAKAVQAKAYKKISASFFAPDSAANPAPGQLYLRHVGFLGGAAPGVPGLKTVSLAARAKGETATFTFAAGQAAQLKEDKKMDWVENLKSLIAKVLGQEAADKLFGSDEMKSAQAELEKQKADAALDKAAAEPAPEAPPAAPAAPAAEGESDEEKKKKEAAASFAALSAREARLNEREKNFRKQTREVLRQQDISFCEDMIRTGRLLPAQKAETLRALEALSTVGEMSFADGGKGSAREALKASIRNAPAKVSFAEGLPGEEKDKDKASFEAPDNYTADPDGLELYGKAKKYQAEHPEISWADAVKAVGG